MGPKKIFNVAAVRIGDDLDCLRRERGPRQTGPDSGGQSGIALDRLLAAAKHTRVSALERERSDVHRHVGPRFVDAGDDAERHPPAAGDHSVRESSRVEHLAYRIRKPGNGPHLACNSGEPVLVESQPFCEGVAEARLGSLLEIPGICDQDGRCRSFESVGDLGERSVFLSG